ncbi:hypothetical protein CYMTET_30874, partial [Cymbomonas tetramitiformis]
MGVWLFAHPKMDASHLNTMSDLFVTRTCSANEVLFSQGTPSDTMYIMARGEGLEEVKMKDGKKVLIRKWHPGTTCGEAAIIDGQAYWKSTVTCPSPSIILMLQRKFFAKAVQQDRELREMVDENITQYNDLAKAPRLALIWPFASLTVRQLEEVVQVMTVEVHYPQSVLFADPGEPCNAFFSVISGEADVTLKDFRNTEASHQTFSQGMHFGHESLCPKAAERGSMRANNLNSEGKKALKLQPPSPGIEDPSDPPETDKANLSVEGVSTCEQRTRLISAFTEDRTVLLVLRPEHLTRLRDLDPQVVAGIEEQISLRHYLTEPETLRRSWVFAPLPVEFLRELNPYFEVSVKPEGEKIIDTDGTNLNTAYIILSGEVAVGYRAQDGSEPMMRYREGDIINQGILALNSGEHPKNVPFMRYIRWAEVVSTKGAVLVHINNEMLDACMAQYRDGAMTQTFRTLMRDFASCASRLGSSQQCRRLFSKPLSGQQHGTLPCLDGSTLNSCQRAFSFLRCPICPWLACFNGLEYESMMLWSPTLSFEDVRDLALLSKDELLFTNTQVITEDSKKLVVLILTGRLNVQRQNGQVELAGPGTVLFSMKFHSERGVMRAEVLSPEALLTMVRLEDISPESRKARLMEDEVVLAEMGKRTHFLTTCSQLRKAIKDLEMHMALRPPFEARKAWKKINMRIKIYRTLNLLDAFLDQGSAAMTASLKEEAKLLEEKRASLQKLWKERLDRLQEIETLWLDLGARVPPDSLWGLPNEEHNLSLERIDYFEEWLEEVGEEVAKQQYEKRRTMETLWQRLEVSGTIKDTILAEIGNGKATVASMKLIDAELARMRQMFVGELEETRKQIAVLWRSLLVPEEDREPFRQRDDELVTEDLLDSHIAELERLRFTSRMVSDALSRIQIERQKALKQESEGLTLEMCITNDKLRAFMMQREDLIARCTVCWDADATPDYERKELLDQFPMTRPDMTPEFAKVTQRLEELTNEKYRQKRHSEEVVQKKLKEKQELQLKLMEKKEQQAEAERVASALKQKANEERSLRREKEEAAWQSKERLEYERLQQRLRGIKQEEEDRKRQKAAERKEQATRVKELGVRKAELKLECQGYLDQIGPIDQDISHALTVGFNLKPEETSESVMKWLTREVKKFKGKMETQKTKLFRFKQIMFDLWAELGTPEVRRNEAIEHIAQMPLFQ